MELLAVIRALESLKINYSNVEIFTDSKYVADAVTKGWVFQWEKKGFKKKKNPDLWKRFLELYRKHTIKIKWVKGHSNIPENERCDMLAVKASYKKKLEEDTGYLAQQNQTTLFDNDI